MSRVFKLRKVISALNKLGFKQVRQNGSHIIFENKFEVVTLVPNHKEIGIGLVIKISKEINIDKKEFLKMID